MVESSALPRVYLVRHGQTEWNATGRAQGHTDICLDDVGTAQALRAGAFFSTIAVDEVWSSDLVRCFTTADAIARACARPVTRYPELRERTFGAWEGEVMAEVRARLEALAATTGTEPGYVRPPGGESHADVWERVLPVDRRLRAATGNVVVVSHGGLMSVLLSSLLEGTLETSRAFRPRNASITELERRPDGGFRLVRFDDVSHL